MELDHVLLPLFKYLPKGAMDACSDVDLADMVACFMSLKKDSSDGHGNGDNEMNENSGRAGTNGKNITEELQRRIGQLRSYRVALDKLLDIPHIPQRTPEWYKMRQSRLTASDLSAAEGRGKFKSRNELVGQKVNENRGKPTPFRGSVATQWGVMFEPMASRIYSEHMGDVKLYEFGLLAHPELRCFGASPDNVSELGIMVEYKCPWRRVITGEIPYEYGVQMQGQMSVCRLSECDFVECALEKINDELAYVERHKGMRTNHGVIVEWKAADGTLSYDYSPANLVPEDALRWARRTASAKMKEDATLNMISMSPWQLATLHIVRVYFDESEWGRLVPIITGFWGDVERGIALADSEAANGAVPTASSSKPSKPARGSTLVLDLEDDDGIPPIKAKKMMFREGEG